MKFMKTLPYKLKRVLPILGIAGASLLAGCNKDDEPTPPGLHDTVYTWPYLQDIPVVDVCMSADSANVRYVMLQYDGVGLSMSVTTLKDFLQNRVISEVTLQNQYKIRGTGEIPSVIMGAQNGEKLRKSRADSTWLANFGFTLTRVIYNDWTPDKQR